MITATIISGIVGALALCIAALVSRRRVRLPNASYPYPNTTADGMLSRRADAAITTRHFLVKIGSDAAHSAVVAAASDSPLGVCIDEPAAAEAPVSIAQLAPGRTLRMVASEAITAGEDVYSAGNGKIQDEPTTAGTYYKVGRALQASTADGETIEVEPCYPVLTKIVANGSTLGQTQAAMISGATVIVLGS